MMLLFIIVFYIVTLGIAAGFVFYMAENKRLIDDDATFILGMIILWPVALTIYAGWLAAQSYNERNKE